MNAPVVVAELIRDGFVEGRHWGSWVIIDPQGDVLAAAGATEEPFLPRSCNKPIQALGMLRNGLPFADELLALSCASHSGESFHVEGVRRMLAQVGLGEDALQCPPDLPVLDEFAHALLRAGGSADPIHMNCSGKHAAMLATCVVNDWDPSSYLDPAHPLQQALAPVFEELTGESITFATADGCGAPLWATSLTSLARAFARLATATEGAEKQIADAIRQHPEYVSGSTRDERALLLALPGAIAKAGAESCYVVALPDGHALALKCADGAARVRPVLMAALIEEYAAQLLPDADLAAVRRTAARPVLVGRDRRVVGELRAVLPGCSV